MGVDRKGFDMPTEARPPEILVRDEAGNAVVSSVPITEWTPEWLAMYAVGVVRHRLMTRAELEAEFPLRKR